MTTPYQASGASSLFGIAKDEFDHAIDMWKKTVTFQYTFDTWIDDVTQCGKIWLNGVAPFFGGAIPFSTIDPVPAVVFVVDAAAEQADPKSVVITGAVDAQLAIARELIQLGTGTDYSAKVHVERQGALLKIGLQDLTTMTTGHSAGVVYVAEQGGSKRALAHLYVTKLA